MAKGIKQIRVRHQRVTSEHLQHVSDKSVFKFVQLLSISTGKRISDAVDDLIHSAKRRKLA